VSAVRNNGNVALTVDDDGNGSGDPGGGIGLANTRERLKHLYPNAHELTLGTGELGGVCVRIEIPFRG
jgi:two-component system sensor histidine kinase AlgZ